jgi:hypothetical protein
MFRKKHAHGARAAAGALLLGAAYSGVSSADIMTAEMRDFTFADGQVVYYATPDQWQTSVEIDDNNRVVAATELKDARGNVLGNLTLSTSGGDDEDYVVFGTLSSSDDESHSALVSSSLDAMQSDDSVSALGFLVPSGGAVTGPDAVLFRNLGIFAFVYGLDRVDWVSGYGDPSDGSLMNLMASATASSTAGGPGNAPAVPGPATPLLLLAGLFGLASVARRSRGAAAR